MSAWHMPKYQTKHKKVRDSIVSRYIKLTDRHQACLAENERLKARIKEAQGYLKAGHTLKAGAELRAASNHPVGKTPTQ